MNSLASLMKEKLPQINARPGWRDLKFPVTAENHFVTSLWKYLSSYFLPEVTLTRSNSINTFSLKISNT